MAYLELSHINKEFAKAAAVNDFNLSAEQGEFISFLGPSGCGKTTTLRMIAGFELPTTGKIRIDGKDLTFVPPNKRNVGMVFQSYALFPNMTVAGNIAYGLKVAGKPRTEIKQKVDEMLALIHMDGFSGRYPSQISGGQQQRVALPRALAIRPRVLLLDEPLSALDAKIRVELRQEIRRIQQQLGITTIYVTHDQEEALSISDRIVVMSEGKIEQIGSSSEIYNFPKTEFVANFVGQTEFAAGGCCKPDRGIGEGWWSACQNQSDFGSYEWACDPVGGASRGIKSWSSGGREQSPWAGQHSHVSGTGCPRPPGDG